MANKKVKPSEDFYDFLPKAVQESTKIKTIAEKNVLATLCYQYLSHSNYAKENEGWFYCKLTELLERCGVELAQLKRVLIKLILQRLIERQSGTKHRCTHYRLHHKIVELLPNVEGDYAANEPLVIKKHNEPLDKNRLDKTSQVKTSLIVNDSIEKNDDLKIHFEEEFSKSSDSVENIDVEALMTEWYYKFKDCESLECFDALKKECFKVFQPLAMNGLLSEERFDDVVRNRMRETETHIRARKPNM